MKVLVVPSNRPTHLAEFVAAWEPVADWDVMLVVFDGPDHDVARQAVEKQPTTTPMHWYSWQDIDRELGDDAWIISRKNAGIRSFGFLKARELGAEVVATLDDDCRPAEDRLFESHAEAMALTAIAESVGSSRWVSSSPNMEARGMPYRNRGALDKVQLNVGLWRGVGDWDAPHSLVGDADRRHFEPVTGQRIIPNGQYVPISTMNLAFVASALPLMYLPKMGQDAPYDRFDDIWGGIILKRVFDHLGWHVSVGRPVVNHERASDPFVNLVKEAAGIRRNETFWEEIDAIELDGEDPTECMGEIGAALRTWEEGYFQDLGKAMDRWLHHVNT